MEKQERWVVTLPGVSRTYHQPDGCPISRNVWAYAGVTEQVARNRGYKACPVCFGQMPMPDTAA